MRTVPTKTIFSFEYHYLLMKPSHFWRMRYLKAHIQQETPFKHMIRHSEVLACYFSELKKKKKV